MNEYIKTLCCALYLVAIFHWQSVSLHLLHFVLITSIHTSQFQFPNLCTFWFLVRLCRSVHDNAFNYNCCMAYIPVFFNVLDFYCIYILDVLLRGYWLWLYLKHVPYMYVLLSMLCDSFLKNAILCDVCGLA